ncbi:MAG: glycosyltransferase family 2 protein [Candidatus Nanoarchaeia archaeon]|nr:glycosyltransferase family 2 protein [Candidatus Nanoarchaeia archaeon]MDD5053849.1 glycosyltransferase family 2 protein [Candidatus Nanoarchaeia archaeon]MDD5499596.1 glycosyltransferase family 2 protein [Candidatus Nanoarchaeia archaeon]
MVDIIVPTLNESESILEFFKTLKKELKSTDFRVILIDDSADNTSKIAKSFCKKNKIKIKAINRKKAKGKGSAINRGLKELNSEEAVIIDADMEYHPKYILPMIKMLKKNDLILSVRKRKDPVYRKFLGYFFKQLVKLLFGFNFDTQSGLKAFKAKSLKNLDLKSKNWVWDIEFINHFFKNNLKIGFYEIEYNTRKKGKSKIKISSSCGMLKDLIKLKMLNFLK